MSFASAQGDLEKLPDGINSVMYDETTPVLSTKGDKLFFTRTADPDFEPALIDEDGQITSTTKDEIYMDRLAMIYSELAGHNISNPATSIYNQDIWFAYIHEDTLGQAIHPGYPLNNALPNSLVSTGMTPDEYVIINQFYEDGSMYAGFSRVHVTNDGRSFFPSPMHIYEFHLSGSDVNMTMTPNGHILVLSMNRSDGSGLNDLFVSFFVRDNVWSAPIHMGNDLNSAFQESSPHISPDKRFLYFSSNRPGSVGGNDIYVSERLDYTWLNWSEPVPVKGNVNSIYDESQPYFDREEKYMYFSSRRDGTSDIFRQRLTPRPKLKKPLYVRGKIVNADTGQPVHSELFWGQLSSSGYLEYFNTYTGEFEVTLTEYEPYKFEPRKANHKSQRILVDPRGMEKMGIDTLELTLYLQPPANVSSEAAGTYKKTPRNNAPIVESNEHLAFYDIHFVKGKPIMLSKSKEALKYLLDLMMKHPGKKILIEGHTDNVGDEVALIDLSIERAEAIKGYLVHRGIASERIQTKGMGATQPRYLNDTESGREKNRRVEIHVIN